MNTKKMRKGTEEIYVLSNSPNSLKDVVEYSKAPLIKIVYLSAC